MISRKYLPSMTLLLTFEVCARLQKFTAAAQELSLTQSAVSRQIKALEEAVGASLFTRNRQNVKLTPAGEVYATEVREALRAIGSSTLRLRADPGAGSLTLAILPTLGTLWLAPLLPDFMHSNPGVTLNLVTKLDLFDLDAEGIHAAIHYGAADWPQAELDLLFGETVVPACSPGMKADLGFSTAADLQALPLLHLKSRPRAWNDWFVEHGVTHAGPAGIVIDQFATVTQAACAGLGVALLPEFLIRSELARGNLVAAVDLQCPSVGSYYLACASSQTRYPPLRAFREWLHRQAVESPP
jgi:LysR family glycine cleavage system transcriptional activator